MSARNIYGKGLGFPPRVGDDGHVRWSEGVNNIEESIRIILSTEPGERLFRPDFGGGLRSFLFQPNTVTTRHQISERIKRALARFEPRISVERVDTLPDPHDPDAAIATVHYRLIATQAPQSLVVGVRLRA